MTAGPRIHQKLTLAEIARGGVFSDGDWVESKDQDPIGSVRLTQLADVGVAVFRNRSSRWMREDQAEALRCTYLEPGDILIARMPEPLGRACIVPSHLGRAVTAVDVAILRIVRDDVDPRYVMWAINSPQFHAQVVGQQSGTTRKRISRKNLSALLLPIPALAEQRLIVDALEDHFSRLGAAEDYLAAALRRAQGFLSAKLWKLTHDHRDAKLVQLSGVAEVRLGRQRSPKNHRGDRMRPYLRAANVGWDELRLDDIKEMQFSEHESAIYELEPGDILLAEASGSASEVGKSVVYRGEVATACFQNTLLRVRCHSALPDFTQKYLLAEALRGRFVSESRGVGIHHLGRARLATWLVSLPPGDAQVAIAAAADKVLESTRKLQEDLSNSVMIGKALRRSLLKAAFSGQLTGRTSDKDLVEEMAGV